MPTLQGEVHAQMVHFLVMKKITCPFRGTVLDERTCGVIIDTDGDPVLVVSPEAADQIREIELTGRDDTRCTTVLKNGWQLLDTRGVGAFDGVTLRG